MSSDNIRAKITEMVRDEFGALAPTVAVDYENTPFDQPVGSAWVKVNVVDGKTIREDLGHQLRFRTPGIINFQIQIPENAGTSAMRMIKDNLEKVFIDRQVPMTGGFITFCNGDFRPPRQIGGWYSRSYQIEFHARWTMSR